MSFDIEISSVHNDVQKENSIVTKRLEINNIIERLDNKSVKNFLEKNDFKTASFNSEDKYAKFIEIIINYPGSIKSLEMILSSYNLLSGTKKVAKYLLAEKYQTNMQGLTKAQEKFVKNILSVFKIEKIVECSAVKTYKVTIESINRYLETGGKKPLIKIDNDDFPNV